MSKQYLDYSGLSYYTDLLKQYIGDSQAQVFYDTTANWAKQTTLVSISGAIYIYIDHQMDGDTAIPGFKVGDGNAYVIDLPFSTKLFEDHIENTTIHITSAERDAWNNKVRCYIDNSNPTNLIFTTN